MPGIGVPDDPDDQQGAEPGKIIQVIIEVGLEGVKSQDQ